MKTLALYLLFLPLLASATEEIRERIPLLLPAATKVPVRTLASVPKQKGNSNQDVFEQLKIGSIVMIQNSFGEWNNQVVKVVEIFDDKSVRVKFDNGRKPIVRFANISKNLSPAVRCGNSHGFEICKGDRVLYPLGSASLMIPEAEVLAAFKNNRALLRDGTDFQIDLEKVGKEVDCSPQKPTICKDAHVMAEGYNDGSRHVLEGTIEKAYTHGPVLVRISPTTLIPIDASAVKKRIAAEAVIDDPAVLSNHGFHGKPSYTTLPELEPLDPNIADHVKEAR